MKFSEIQRHYYETTGKASDVARQLAFAGFAAIWLFREGTAGINVPGAMIPAAAGFALALIFDASQYGVAAIQWRDQADRADAACESDDDECEVPLDINQWPRYLFNAKLLSVSLSYVWYIGSLFAL